MPGDSLCGHIVHCDFDFGDQLACEVVLFGHFVILCSENFETLLSESFVILISVNSVT